MNTIPANEHPANEHPVTPDDYFLACRAMEEHHRKTMESGPGGYASNAAAAVLSVAKAFYAADHTNLWYLKSTYAELFRQFFQLGRYNNERAAEMRAYGHGERS